jgi:hypothetical protein
MRLIKINSSQFKSFPTAQSWRHAYKLLQKILKSIKHLGIFLAKMVSSFFTKTEEQERFFRKFIRKNRKNQGKDDKNSKSKNKMDGKQAEQFFAMCFTLNTLLRSKFMSYRYVCFLARVVLHDCKSSWINSRKRMK